MRKLEQRVLRGAKFLDRHEPGWHRRVQLELLDLNSSVNCVLGQVFGFYNLGRRRLIPVRLYVLRPLAYAWSIRHGFLVENNWMTHKARSLWTTEIADRNGRDYLLSRDHLPRVA